MSSRKVVKSKASLYINIPSDLAEALEITPGDRWTFNNIPGTGLLITPGREDKKIELNLESVERIKRAADIIYSQTEKRLKSLESNIISNIVGRLIPAIAGSGIFELQRKVDRLERRDEEYNREKGKLSLVRNRKKAP